MVQEVVLDETALAGDLEVVERIPIRKAVLVEASHNRTEEAGTTATSATARRGGRTKEVRGAETTKAVKGVMMSSLTSTPHLGATKTSQHDSTRSTRVCRI